MEIGHYALAKLFQSMQAIVRTSSFPITIVPLIFFRPRTSYREVGNVHKYLFNFIEPADDVDAEGWVVSSESCGFLSIGARYVREVTFFF